MNAPAQISLRPTEDPWPSAINAVNAWRGSCLHSFTQAENAVTECLVHLKEGGHVVPLRPLMGHRFADLAILVRPAGVLAAQGSQVAETLSAFQGYEELRADLAHGLCSIALKKKGECSPSFSAFRSVKAMRSEPSTAMMKPKLHAFCGN